MGIDITGLGALANAAKDIADKFWPDKTEVEKAKMAMELQEVMNQYNLTAGQVEVNKVEAGSANWFVAGWRPFIGWVCGVSLIYQFLAYPLLNHYLQMTQLDGSTLNDLLTGMLGLGVMRTVEKYNGSQSNH